MNDDMCEEGDTAAWCQLHVRDMTECVKILRAKLAEAEKRIAEQDEMELRRTKNLLVNTETSEDYRQRWKAAEKRATYAEKDAGELLRLLSAACECQAFMKCESLHRADALRYIMTRPLSQ